MPDCHTDTYLPFQFQSLYLLYLYFTYIPSLPLCDQSIAYTLGLTRISMLFLFQCITYSILLFCHKCLYFVTALSGAIRSSSSFRFALSSFFNNPLSCCCGFALELCSIEQFFSSSFENDGARVGSLVHSSYDIGTLGLRVRIFTPYGGLLSE